MADALTDLQEAPASDVSQAMSPVPAPTTAALDPNAGAPPDQSQSDIWSRIQDAVKKGLISSDQFKQIAAKMGYTPQNVAQTPGGAGFKSGVKSPDIAGNGAGGLGSSIGSSVGNTIGTLGRKAYDAATAPSSPGPPLDINPSSPQPATSAVSPSTGDWQSAMPSPAWNQ